MPFEKIYAQLNCRDMSRSEPWFLTLFGREPDANPMDGLKEWHHRRDAGFQLFENEAGAGHGTLTIIVGQLERERERLRDAGFEIGEIVRGDFASILRLSDPDGNTVVLAEPG